jgi:hypothetical protein
MYYAILLIIMQQLFKFQLISWKYSLCMCFTPYVLFIETTAMLDNWQDHQTHFGK